MGLFEAPSWLLAWFYGFTNSYLLAISLIAVVVMLVITPLTLKSTKGMLQMQKLAPEMRRLQNEYRSDRQQLNAEMMKLYQEHKVNPMSSCLPIVAQMPVFIIMFRILYGLAYRPTSNGVRPLAHAAYAAVGEPRTELGFLPRYIARDSGLFQSMIGQTEMNSIGLDLSRSAAVAIGASFGSGLLYVAIVAALGGLYFFQQRMVAARAAVSPTMSPGQQKLMQYLPVVFAVFQVFFMLGLVVYYIAQAILRIIQQWYITKAFYGHDEAIGRQAQRAGERAREMADKDGDGGGGIFGQMKRDLASARGDGAAAGSRNGGSGKTARQPSGDGGPPQSGKPREAANGATARSPKPTKRTTPPKGRPTPSGRSAGSRPGGRPGGPRGKQSSRRRK